MRILSVDFDHCLARPIVFPIRSRTTWLNKAVHSYVRRKHAHGWTVILNTMRENGKGLEYAVAYCESNNIPIDLVNTNPQEETDYWGFSRKIGCTRSIDDTQVGLIGWALRKWA